MQTNTPGRPDLPYKPELATPVAEPKKHRGWIIAASILGGLVLLGAGSAINSGEPGTRVVDPVTISQPIEQPADSNMEAARVAWQTAITAEDRAAICAYYNTPPVGITADAVEIFAESSGLDYDEAERVLGTLLAEEC